MKREESQTLKPIMNLCPKCDKIGMQDFVGIHKQLKDNQWKCRNCGYVQLHTKEYRGVR